MRLSDAIALGRTLVKMERSHIRGCALGMANESISGVGYSSVESEWPWMIETFSNFPCECGGHRSVEGVIIHLFDWHVMGKEEKNWTLDQLIDWVRSVEPSEAVETHAEEKTIAESAPSLVAQG